MLSAIAAALGLAVLAYLLGSLPTGYLAGRWLQGIDIREHGSRSTGATNVLRVMGKGPALVVFVIDVLKGVAAVLAMRSLWPLVLNGGTDLTSPLSGLTVDWMVAIGALLAVLGHSRPVWLGFRGGKSVATGLGVLFAMHWPVALAALGAFALTISISRIVSLSSMVAATVMAIAMVLAGVALPYILFALLGASYVILRHRANIERLLAGTEPKLGQPSPASSASSP